MEIRPIERFEAVAELYAHRYGRLAPGKSEPMKELRSSGDPENIKQYDEWRKTLAFDDAIKKIVFLEKRLDEVENED